MIDANTSLYFIRRARVYLQSVAAILFLMLSFSITAEPDSTDDCGDYDPATAIKFKNEYIKALRARDYEQLKKLKEERESVDLWAKTKKGNVFRVMAVTIANPTTIQMTVARQIPVARQMKVKLPNAQPSN